MMRIESRKELRDLPATVHGGQGWREQGVEDYSQNLNPMGPIPDMDSVLRECMREIGHYPDADSMELRKAIATHYGLDVANVTMGAGSSEIIRDFPQVFIDPGESVLMPSPSFAEYSQQCRIAGVHIDYFPLLPEEDFYLNEERLYSVLGSKHYAAMYICNPNNPTGRVEGREKLVRIIRRCEELGTMVFLDETLLELVSNEEEVSLSRQVREFTNLIIAHSFTKSFAIPGMRVGFALASEAIVGEMEKVKLPWNVGTVEQAVAEHLIRYEMPYVRKAAEDMREESEVMQVRLHEAGFPVDRVSDSFFYFISLRGLGLTGASFKELMLKEGIMVRDCASFGPEFADYVRFCVKDEERNRRFVAAVTNVLKSLKQ